MNVDNCLKVFKYNGVGPLLKVREEEGGGGGGEGGGGGGGGGGTGCCETHVGTTIRASTSSSFSPSLLLLYP